MGVRGTGGSAGNEAEECLRRFFFFYIKWRRPRGNKKGGKNPASLPLPKRKQEGVKRVINIGVRGVLILLSRKGLSHGKEEI